MMTSCVYVLDTSAFLSGKPLDLSKGLGVTCPLVVAELRPGGRDYRNFMIVHAQGLRVEEPCKESMQRVVQVVEELGEQHRLSQADVQLLALALMYVTNSYKVVLFSDDYSIQNVAEHLCIPYQGLSEKGITKKLKWYWRCPGCRKTFDSFVKRCPICGKEPRHIPRSIKKIKKKR